MKKRKSFPLLCLLALLLGAVIAWYRTGWGFAREVGTYEKELRLEVVQTAESWLGAKESDGSHQEIIDIYNAHTPLARGYKVTYTDAWCATFDSVVAIQCGLTDIIPTECGCDPQIALFQAMNCWEEDDAYVPLPGDLIFYHWNCLEQEDCTDSTDHVGFVVGTAGPFIKVIEGNRNNDVSYRYTRVDAAHIRGYGLPDYSMQI